MSTDPMAYVLSCLRRAADNAHPWSLTPTEAGALVAEVERLRELLLNAGWPREADGIAELALQAERAAVVAWLRKVAPSAPTRRGADELTWCAERIERGEHRREEKT